MGRKYPLERTAIIKVKFTLSEESDEDRFPYGVEAGIRRIGCYAEMVDFEWNEESERSVLTSL